MENLELLFKCLQKHLSMPCRYLLHLNFTKDLSADNHLLTECLTISLCWWVTKLTRN